MSPVPAVAIVGAGPAGIRAAEVLVRHGVRPVLLDEASRYGGQIYRQPAPDFKQRGGAVYGFEAGRAERLHRAMEVAAGHVDYRPRTLVWNAEPGRLDLLADGRYDTLPYTHLVIASGAADRVLPFEGWTTPGVYSLGGAQVALKFQGCAIGSAVAFVGTGPLLYLVSYQYAKSGANVVGVFDSAGFVGKVRAAPGMLRQPAVLGKGMYYVAALAARGVPVHGGARPVRVGGGHRVAELVWHDGRRERSVACDAVGAGHGLRSETQLADLLGCAFAYDPLHRAHLPVRDAAGRTSIEGVYVAGDGAGILGADAAEWAGERAALALVEDIGRSVDARQCAALERKLARQTVFKAALEQAFPLPADWAGRTHDDTIICRCENLTAGELRRAATGGATELNRLKALTRVGMGRCQGRTCGAATAEIVAHTAGLHVSEVGRFRTQPPVKPIPLEAPQSDEVRP